MFDEKRDEYSQGDIIQKEMHLSYIYVQLPTGLPHVALVH